MEDEKIYPRTGDKQTVYLKSVVQSPNIIVGEYSMHNDFARDPKDFEKNNVLYHYPVNGDKLIMGKFCSVACGAKFLFTRSGSLRRPSKSCWKSSGGTGRRSASDGICPRFRREKSTN